MKNIKFLTKISNNELSSLDGFAAYDHASGSKYEQAKEIWVKFYQSPLQLKIILHIQIFS